MKEVCRACEFLAECIERCAKTEYLFGSRRKGRGFETYTFRAGLSSEEREELYRKSWTKEFSDLEVLNELMRESLDRS
jgi:hypothetical protein